MTVATFRRLIKTMRIVIAFHFAVFASLFVAMLTLDLQAEHFSLIARASIYIVFAVIILGSAPFIAHVLRRPAISRGRRAGWLVYMLVAPWAALPSYYSEEIAPDAARIAETCAPADMPEVVLPTSRVARARAASVPLTGEPEVG